MPTTYTLQTAKTMLAVPCMQTVPTRFMRCLVSLRRTANTYTTVTECSMIHDARNDITSTAIRNGFDRILWIDSDMTFDNDLLFRLSVDLDEHPEAGMVTALCFKRTLPTAPTIYSELREMSEPIPHIQPVPMLDYPKDAIFPVAACGFAAVMTRVDMLRDLWDRYGPPFLYHMNIGEDFSCCWRAAQAGHTILCDSRIRVGHIGHYVFDEQTYLMQQASGQQTADAPHHDPADTKPMHRFTEEVTNHPTMLR